MESRHILYSLHNQAERHYGLRISGVWNKKSHRLLFFAKLHRYLVRLRGCHLLLGHLDILLLSQLVPQVVLQIVNLGPWLLQLL